MNGSVDDCENSDGSFMFTSESVGEGHPGEYGTLLGVVSPLSRVCCGWGGGRRPNRGMQGVRWFAQRGECEIGILLGSCCSAHQRGVPRIGAVQEMCFWKRSLF